MKLVFLVIALILFVPGCAHPLPSLMDTHERALPQIRPIPLPDTPGGE